MLRVWTANDVFAIKAGGQNSGAKGFLGTATVDLVISRAKEKRYCGANFAFGFN